MIEKPAIARVNGDAIGFGQSLLWGCDILVGVEFGVVSDVHMGQGDPVDHRGERRGFPYAIAPGDGAMAFLPLFMPPTKAKEYQLLSRAWTVRELEEMGVFNYALAELRGARREGRRADRRAARAAAARAAAHEAAAQQAADLALEPGQGPVPGIRAARLLAAQRPGPHADRLGSRRRGAGTPRGRLVAGDEGGELRCGCRTRRGGTTSRARSSRPTTALVPSWRPSTTAGSRRTSSPTATTARC